MPSTTTLRLAAAALCAALAGPAAAKLYKWVDEDGNVTYSERKPPDRPAETVRLHGVRPADPDAAAHLDELRDKAETARKDREFARSEADALKEREKRLKENCEIARENLRILRSSARIQAKDESGNPYFLDDAGIQAKIKESEQQVADYCG